MNEYHKYTCIRFVPRTNEDDYVSIEKTGDEYGEGYVQIIHILPLCYIKFN